MIDSTQPESLAQAVVEALEAPLLRELTAQVNTQIVRDWAGYADGMSHAEAFYSEVILRSPQDQRIPLTAKRDILAML